MQEATQSQIKHWLKLHQKKYRQEFGEFLVEGKKMVDEALQSGWQVKTILLSQQKFESYEQDHKDCVWLSSKDAKKLSQVETFPGIAAVVKAPKESIAVGDDESVLVLEKISDPGNLGTIIRTADWFGIRHLFLGPDSVDLYNDKVLRSSMGSAFYVQVHVSSNLQKDLQNLASAKRKLYATTIAGGAHPSTIKTPAIIIFGHESKGLSDALKGAVDQLISIPKVGRAESLNLATSVAVILGQLNQM